MRNFSKGIVKNRYDYDKLVRSNKHTLVLPNHPQIWILNSFSFPNFVCLASVVILSSSTQSGHFHLTSLQQSFLLDKPFVGYGQCGYDRHDAERIDPTSFSLSCAKKD